MNNDKLLSFLGLCKRAGKLISGAETVTKATTENKALLVLYADDVSEGSIKRVLREAREREIPARKIERTKDELSFALGKYCAIIGITDPGFAKKLLELTD